MGIKRKGIGVNKSDDKKARYEAGLDLGFEHKELDESMLDQIVKEVSAPKPVKQQIDQFIADFIKFVKKSKLPKSLTSAQQDNVEKMSGNRTSSYSGAKIVDCEAVGSLKSRTLVFPKAEGHIQVTIKLNNQGQSNDADMTSAVSQLMTALENCPLLKKDSVQFSRQLFTKHVSIVATPAAKFGKHFTLVVSAVEEADVVHQQSDSLVSQQPYQAAAMALEIWRRQCCFALPSHMLPVLLLHTHSLGLTNVNMKSWQIVKKLWSFLSDKTLTEKQVILGVSDLVPVSNDHGTAPMLDRDGQAPLFTDLTCHQWNGLVQFAAKSLHQNVEKALLKSWRPDAIYDRVFTITGQCDIAKLVRDLSRALEQRVTMLAIVGGSRSLGSQPTVDIGVRFDSELYSKPSTLGPVANCAEAAGFRQFWGDRSELRRFQDGVVREVVVWAGVTDITTEIVTAVLARHHKGCTIDVRGLEVESLLQGDGGAAARLALDKLTPVLYGFQDLPLKIAGVSAIGPQASSSLVADQRLLEVGGKLVEAEHGVAKINVKASKNGMAPSYIEPLDVVLIPEQSGKWPRDEEARRRVGVAWLIELRKCLARDMKEARTVIMGERLVVMLDGQVIRFMVGTRSAECEVTSWLSGVDKSHRAYSGCARLVKRWLAAHLLSSVPELAVEVSVATVLASAPLCPVSQAAAFKLWLHTMATHDWNTSALLHPDCPHTDMDRSQLPPMAILHPHCPSPSHWTQSVSWPELQRITSLASMALSADTTMAMFTPNLTSYDILIHLKPLQVPTRHMAVANILGSKQSSTPKSEAASVKTIPILSHDNVQTFVSVLIRCYANIAKFYYDKYGGTVIGVKLLDHNSGSKTKITEVAGHLVNIDGNSAKVELNLGAIVEDWKILGNKLVKEVEILKCDILL